MNNNGTQFHPPLLTCDLPYADVFSQYYILCRFKYYTSGIKDMSQKLRVGFTCSAFDLCHPGHVAMLEEAKSQCDYLIAGLQNDPTVDRPTKNKPIQTVVERYILLRGSKYIDEIIPYNTEQDLELILSILPIDVRILGVEYKDKDFTGKNICVARNIELYFNSRDHGCSSTDLRRRVAQAEAEK